MRSVQQHARLGRVGKPRLARPGAAALAAALAVEFADELFDGTKSAAMPLIRHDLALSYLQIGLLAAVPLIVGSLLELPFGVVAGSGQRRRRFILAGGVAFAGSVLAAGLAGSFTGLLLALVVFFPASGLFVSLTQADLMDAAPSQRARQMARWTLAGSAGAVTGSLLVVAVLAGGGTWRLAFGLVAACCAATWLATAGTGTLTRRASGPASDSKDDAPSALPAGAARSPAAGAASPPGGCEAPDPGPLWPGWHAAGSIIWRSGVLRWQVLLQFADLLLDVLTPFVAVYLVDVGRATPSVAALGIAVRLAAGLAGDAALIPLLSLVRAASVLRASAVLAALLLPAFLLVPGLGPKLALLAALTLATTPWYPLLQAEMYASLPGQSGLAVSVSSASGLVGGLGPVVVGLLAEQFGLSWALAGLCMVPIAMLAVLASRRPAAGRARSDRLGHHG